MYLYIKRFIDLIFSIIFLPFVVLILIVIIPIVYITDPGPVFYNAVRIGKGFKEFKMYKLRSMYINAPDIRNADGSTYNSDNDSRITPFGRVLRKTSLDEIPQVFNVLKGDMSFVGPRPILPQDFSTFTDRMRFRTSVRPGITGYNQAYFRNAITRAEKYENDAIYVDRMSLFFDIKILLKTIQTVLLRKNINQI